MVTHTIKNKIVYSSQLKLILSMHVLMQNPLLVMDVSIWMWETMKAPWALSYMKTLFEGCR